MPLYTVTILDKKDPFIIGAIVIGVVIILHVAVGILAVLVLCLCWRKTKKHSG